jgi:iron(III) transport system permease protein
LALRGVGIVLAVAFAFPGLYVVWRNISTGADPIGMLGTSRTLAPLGRTLQLAVLVSAASAAIGTALAWLTTRTDVPLRRLWRMLLPIPLVFPTFIGAAAFIRTLNPGGLANDLLDGIGIERTFELRGLFGAWLVLTLFTYPYVYLPVAARLQRLAGSLEESARVLGDTAGQTFRRIVLPQITSAILAGTLLVFLYTISDFGAVQLMRYDTLTRAINTNYLARPSVAFALSLLLLVLAVAVVIGERAVTRSTPQAGSARSTRVVQYRLGAWRWPAAALVVLVASLAVGAPLVAMLDWAGDGIIRATRDGRPLTVDADKVFEAARHTLESSVLAALAAVAAVLPIALLVGRYRSRSGSFSHAIVIGSFALPGILIALALRFWTLRSGFAGELFADSKALLIFAYVVRFGSLAMGITLVAVQSVPDRFHDVGATLGAGRLRRFRTIDLPLMTPGLLAAVGLVLLSTMKELPISLLIAPIGYQTLTTRIFSSFEESFVAEAGIMAVVLVAMSGVLSWLLVLRRAEHR